MTAPLSLYNRLMLAVAALAALTGAGGAFGDSSVPTFKVSQVKQDTQTIAAGPQTWSIVLGGKVDMDAALTRHFDKFIVAFQPNISLTVANTGQEPVVNPRVVANGRGRWWSVEEMVKEITAPAGNDQERALLIWQFCRSNRVHTSPLFGKVSPNEIEDPVKLFNSYGGGICGNVSVAQATLLHRAGFTAKRFGKDPMSRSLHGHVMTELYLGGGFQFLDCDQDCVYLDRENEGCVSGDEVTADHELAKREMAFGPVFGEQAGEKAAALFGTDDTLSRRVLEATHRVDLTLRPGESIVYRWDNVGKVASDGGVRPRYWGNSLIVYEPRLDEKSIARDAADRKDLVAPAPGGPARVAGGSADACLTYEVRSPYPICGGRVQAGFVGAGAADGFEVAGSLDGKEFKKIWSGRGEGAVACDAAFDKQWQPARHAVIYRYFVRVSLASSAAGSAGLKDLRITTDVMTFPLGLPRLRLGENRIEYADETPGRREVAVTWKWRECDDVSPPPAPALTGPADEATVARSTFDFTWKKVHDARRYHIQVSRYPDFRLIYRTYFDTIVEGTSHGSPTQGMFSPETDYYWRVRAEGPAGVWGRWSQVRRFRWAGPRVPVEVKRHIRGNRITISWKPNPRGPRPAAYEVYGSDERGFSISKVPYKVKGLAGPRPANFLARTTDTEMQVVGPELTGENCNRSFYRVVAVDAAGVASGCSAQVELPHPFVWSDPVTAATAGKPYRCEVRTLRSIGDLQHRYADPTQKFWEEEGYVFSLAAGPAWLKIDQATGVLTGTPGDKDAGQADVEVLVTRSWPHDIAGGKNACHSKSAARFQASCRQKFRITVGS